MKRCVFLLAVIFVLAAAVPQAFSAAPRGSVTFTIDDGYESAFYIARRVFGQYNFRATLFPVTSRIGTPGYLEDWQLYILKRDGYEIGCHTRNHSDTSGMSPEELRAEILATREEFRNLVGVQMSKAFAPPFGAYNPEVISELIWSDVISSSRQAWLEDSPFNTPDNFDPGAIRVVSVKTNTSTQYVRRILSTASERGWRVVLVFHNLIPNGSAPRSEYDITERKLDQIVQHVRWLQRESGRRFQILTISQMVRKMLNY